MKTVSINQSAQILRLGQLCAQIGLSRSSIYNKLSKSSPYFDETFPRPFKLGVSAIGWDAAQIEAWKVSRIAASADLSRVMRPQTMEKHSLR